MKGMRTPRFYLGANSPDGFYGYFQKAYAPGWQVWLIKGGPGSGKSTLMRRVTELSAGQWEEIHCSSDPDSLDAVICAEKKVMLADATAPHAMEAVNPGCVEQLVDMGAGFDVPKLRRNAEAIRLLHDKNKALHRRAVHYLAAAAQVQQVRMEQAECGMDAAAVRRAARLWVEQQDLCPEKHGAEQQRGLCAVTPDGILCFRDTPEILCGRVCAVQDDWGTAAVLFIQEVRAALLRQSIGFITCCCSIFPQSKPEHLLMPNSRTALVTSNQAHPFASESCTGVDLRDMYGVHRPGTQEELRRMLAQETQLLETASGCMYQARLVHDELERYYIDAMDFSLAQQTAEEIAEQIVSVKGMQ